MKVSIRRGRLEPEPVSQQADAGAGGAPRPEIDRRVADHDGVVRTGARGRHQVIEARRIRLPPVCGIAADDPPEERRDPESGQDPLGRVLRLVREDRQRRPRRQVLERFARPVVEARVDEQALVIQLEEPRQRRRDVRLQLRRGQRPPHQQRRSLADHRRDRLHRQRLPAALDDQRIRGIGKVPPRVD
jgi:hypothetical protein